MPKKISTRAVILFAVLHLISANSHALNSEIVRALIRDAIERNRQNVEACLQHNIVTEQCMGLVHQWRQEIIEPTFIFVNVGDILVPIQIEEREVIYRNLSKEFEFSYEKQEQGLINTTNIASGTTQNTVTRNYRPTLFVTIPGANFDNSDGRGVQTFQSDISQFIRRQALDYNAAVWNVSWDSLKPNRRQVKMLQRQIINFLDDQRYDWDVVIVGFSRGGIFANELALQLEGNENIHYLYTVLLDPTAALSINDHYPTEAPKSNLTSNHLFYDGRPWLGVDFNKTDADRSIHGYPSATLIGANHEDVPTQYISKGYWQSLFNLTEANKNHGNYNEPFYWQENVVRISLSSDIDIAVDVENGIFAESNAGPVYFTSQIYGENGNLHVGNSITSVSSMYASVGEDGVQARASLAGTDFGFSTNGVDEISLNHEQFGAINVGANISTTNVQVEFEIFGETIRLDSNGFIEDLLDHLGNPLEDVEDFLDPDPFDFW